MKEVDTPNRKREMKTGGCPCVVIHLEKQSEIDRVVLPLFSGVDTLAIQVWNGSCWSEVFRGSTSAQVLFGFEPVVTDKVRLQLIGSPSAKIYEIQVYAADPQPVLRPGHFPRWH